MASTDDRLDIEVWLTHEAADGFAPNVNVLTRRRSIENAPAFIEDFELGDSRTVTGPGGGELAVIEYSGKAGGAVRPLRFLAVWALHEGNAIVTTFTTLAENFEAQRDDVLPYLLTLEPT